MTSVEFYLRKALNDKTNSVVLNELLNYILDNGYTPDYTGMLRFNGIIKFKNSNNYGYLYLNDEKRVVFVENGIILDSKSNLLGYGIRKSTTIDEDDNITIEIKICDGFIQNILEFNSESNNATYNNGKTINNISLDAFKVLEKDIKDRNIMLTLLMNYFNTFLENNNIKKERSYEY